MPAARAWGSRSGFVTSARSKPASLASRSASTSSSRPSATASAFSSRAVPSMSWLWSTPAARAANEPPRRNRPRPESKRTHGQSPHVLFWSAPPSRRLKLPAVELRRWPRKNDPASIRVRQEVLRDLTQDGVVFWDDLEPFTKATEALTGVAVVPVAVVGPIDVELGEYELSEPEGRLAERSRSRERVYVPLANTEGGLAISLYRGARAV